LTPEALPAVMLPPRRNSAGRRASFSAVVSGRGCSSRSTTSASPLRCGTSTGTISSAMRPDSIASRARICERSAKASWSRRSMWCSSATFSAVSGIDSMP